MKSTLIAALVAAALGAPSFAANAVLVTHSDPLGDDTFQLHGQYLAAADDTRGQADAWRRWADDYSRELRSSLGTMFGPRMGATRLVKGAPYSAEVITEMNQSLADGNVITRRTTGLIYRDSEGRTRQETAAEGKERTVFINDPVEQKHYILTPGAKRAIVMPRSLSKSVVEGKEKKVVKLGATEIRIEDGKLTVDGKEIPGGKYEGKAAGKEVRVENGRITIDGKEIGGAEGPGKVIVKTERDPGDGTRREEVRVQVVRAGGPSDADLPIPPMPPMPPMPPVPPGGFDTPLPPPMPPMPGVHTLHFESTAKLGKGVTTKLGTKDVEGVKAEGTSTVWTIPAGEIGNRSAIRITSETWYSPDLQVTVMSRHSDPRTGESIYRLASIKRAEPARDLFTIPEDYKTRERGKRE